ncbi:MAG TPA: ATP-binding protein, partial [Phycisphaerae bacterium]
DERVLHYLTGVGALDERLAAMAQPIASVALSDLAASHERIAQGMVAAWSASRGRERLPVIQLCAADIADCRPIVAAAADAVGWRAIALPADLIPSAPAELDALIRLWEREAALGGAMLLVETDSDSPSADDGRLRHAIRLMERLNGPVVVSSREPRPIVHRPSIKFDVSRPTSAEQRAAWAAAIPQSSAALSGTIASQFSMSIPAIHALAAEAMVTTRVKPGSNLSDVAWSACRARCRTRLDGLAQRIEPAAGWDDLVLPDPQMQSLRQIAIHVRHRATVYETWGFAARSSRGLGIAALFAGTSGTGKTMAAEVLAADLKLDLYRIDLASMVSKYIGETEKNLRKVFDAAEESGAILLFDEADALFGKRSEVKDSHDRYANIEVSYLLQRVEAYRGLAILTSNLKSALDPAFLRRLRFVIQFPFPDAPQRAEIWRRIFPRETPTSGLDAHVLARLNIAGGHIRNIALNAAFLAANSGGTVTMSHLLAAARNEYVKLERPLAEIEIGGWK